MNRNITLRQLVRQSTLEANSEFWFHLATQPAIARKRNENDFHGLGAFLIMNEQIGAASVGYKPKPLSWKAN